MFLPLPSWDTSAVLSGLPVKIWKKRDGIEMHGTLAQCVERFLSLPVHQQRDCTLRIVGRLRLKAWL
jgi:hypothetical protein